MWQVFDSSGRLLTSTSSSGIGGTVTSPHIPYASAPNVLSDSWLKNESDGITLQTGKLFRSDVANKAELNFGAAGNELYFLTDGIAGGNEGLLRVQTTQFEIAVVNHTSILGATSSLTIHQDTELILDSPLYTFSQLTASTVPYLNASKRLVSSTTTPTQLGYLSSATGTSGTTSTNLVFSESPTFTGNVTINANITFTPTVNSSLSGANQRIPSHTTTNMVFTNAGLTSIGSANNGGVSGGHTICITNETGASITIVNNYVSAAAGEAIYTGVAGDMVMPNHSSIWLQYDATASAWVSVAGGLIPVSTGISGLGTSIATFLATPSSANLASAITDETGSASGGVLVFNNSPTIITPTIASFTNATHNHQNAAGGGTLDATAVFGSTILPVVNGGSQLLSKNYTPASNAGDANELLLHSHQIASGKLASGDLIEVMSSWLMTSSTNAKTLRIYVNTSNSLSGATLIGTSSVTVANTGSNLQRFFPIISDTALECYSGTSTTSTTNYANTNGTSANVTVPSVSAGFWILISGQKASSGETNTIRWSMVRGNKT